MPVFQGNRHDMKTLALRPARLVLACALALAGSDAADADVVSANPSNYLNALAGLAPGDTLMLASGTYTEGLPIDDLSGAAGRPIKIVGADDQSSRFVARACCNTVQLDGAAYLEIRNLTLDGANIDGPFGVDARGNTHDITLENLRIVNHGAEQQTVGISTKGPAWNWIIRRNTIIGAGTGIYLGNSDGTQPFVAGIIENNLIVDTLGYNMQVKHQLPRPTGIGLPTGNSRTIIRNNVFSKRNNGSTADLARPNLLVGHLPLSGAGAGDRYEIYGNFFYENPTEALFQGEGNIALHDNLFVNASGSAINIQPHLDAPRDVVVYHNTVVASGNGIRVTGGAAGFTQRIIGNAAFAATPISGPNQSQNVTGTYAAASTELNAPFAAIGTLDLFPKSGRLSGATIDLSSFGQYADGTRDFDGRSRAGTFRGAYEGSGTNNGWRLALQIKPPGLGSATRPCPPPTVTVEGGTSANTACGPP
jgi:hypothetical protein